MKKIIILSLVVTLFLGSCTTYEYDPLLSFRSPTSRLVGEWVLDKAIIDDRENMSILEREKNDTITFKENGEYFKTDGIKTDIGGTWEFLNDKKNLLISEVEEGRTTVIKEYRYEILKLSSGELWIIDDIRLKSGQQSRVERRYNKINN